MGCDIHEIVEIQHNGEWKPVMDIGTLSPRNYALFAELFGVRGYSSLGKKHYGGRGMPVNRHYRTASTFCEECDGDGHPEMSRDLAGWIEKYGHGKKYCQDCGDWHSPSYITIQEIEQHYDLIKQCIGKESYQQEWHVVFDTMRFWAEYLKEQVQIVESTPALSTGKEDTSRVRLIVWFDN